MKKLLDEIVKHIPFTLLGAVSGIILMVVFKGMPHETAHTLFYIFHPLHICLSAIVTASLFKLYIDKKQSSKLKFLKVLVVGYVGSIVIGTVSDSLIPFWGESILNMKQSHTHIGFIDKWWLINPLVILSIVFAYFRPITKISHLGHILISTWASMFHMLMASGHSHATPYVGILIFLFIAVWIPCLFSDIAFPMLLVSKIKINRESNQEV